MLHFYPNCWLAVRWLPANRQPASLQAFATNAFASYPFANLPCFSMRLQSLTHTRRLVARPGKQPLSCRMPAAFFLIRQSWANKVLARNRLLSFVRGSPAGVCACKRADCVCVGPFSLRSVSLHSLSLSKKQSILKLL